MTHVITHWTLGDPSEALLGEGIAVHLDQSGNDPDATTVRLQSDGESVALGQLVGSSWFKQDPAVAYAEAGSFVRFLVNEYGIDRFKAIYAQKDMNAAMSKTYGMGLAMLEKKWLETFQHPNQ